MSEQPTERRPEPYSLRRLVFSSLLVGMTPLIPVPLVDDWARDVMRRRLTADLVQHHDIELGAEDLELLALGRREITAGGCLRSCASSALGLGLKLVLKVFRKFARKILFFLTVKDCVDSFSKAFHEGHLLRHALMSGAFEEHTAGTVRQAVEATLVEVDVRPFERQAGRILRGGFRLVRRGARQLFEQLETWRKSSEHDEVLHPGEERRELEQDAAIGGLVDELTEQVQREESYLRGLESHFERRLERSAAGVGEPDSRHGVTP